VFYDLRSARKTVVEDVDGYEASARDEALVWKKEDYATSSPPDQKPKKLATQELERTIDPRTEWRQLFDDAWRFERDYFYDPGLHGVNWSEMRQRYGRLLEDAVTRWDVNFVIGELIAELNSSHSYRGGGDLEEGLKRGVGMLGVDFSLENGAYRIKRILRGAPWDTEVRSPLDRPGVDVKQGDYLLAVDHALIDVGKDPWAAFQGLAKKTVLLTVNSTCAAGRARGARRDPGERGPPAQPGLDRGEAPQGGRRDEGRVG
jgi:tricorn protease